MKDEKLIRFELATRYNRAAARAYLKINMAPNDLCIALNISKDGLRKKRYRLKKKLQLDKKTRIKDYIGTI